MRVKIEHCAVNAKCIRLNWKAWQTMEGIVKKKTIALLICTGLLIVSFNCSKKFIPQKTISENRETIVKLGSNDIETQKSAITEILSAPDVQSPPVLYMLSAILFRTNRQSEAVKWFYIAQLRATYDANRCTDKTASGAVTALNQQVGLEINKYAFKDKAFLQQQVMDAISHVENHTELYDPSWISQHGMQATLSALNSEKIKNATYPEADWPDIKKKTINRYREGFKEALKMVP